MRAAALGKDAVGNATDEILDARALLALGHHRIEQVRDAEERHAVDI